MNLELYRIFYAVAEEKNITKASQKLNISQPAVTKQIKNLEDLLGEKLFIRTKKGVVLNVYGEKIYLKVKQALNLLDDCEKEINHYKDINYGTVNIGISTSLVRKYLLKHIEKFHEKYPNIILNIHTDRTSDLIKKLKNGNVDLIVSKFPNDKDLELNYYKLGTTRYFFAAGKKFSYLSNKKIDKEELTNIPILLLNNNTNSRISADKYFKDNNIKANPIMSVASSNLLIDFIKIGYGIGYVTELYVLDELKKKELFEIKVSPNPGNIDYGIMTLKKNVMSSCCDKFVEFLKKNN